MGKATIVSGGADGLYQVELDYGNATKTARLAAIDARLAALVGLIAQALQNLNTQEYTGAQVEAEVESAITAYVAAAQALGALASDADPAVLKALQEAVKNTLKIHADAVKRLAEAIRKTAPLRLVWQALKAEQVQLQKDRAKWADLKLTETVPAWCADLTEGASGEVATIEIPGESKLVLIAPAAPPSVDADGLLTAREVQSPEQVFFNAAVLPGWQKFNPTYRRGTVTAVDEDADTVDVALDTADVSSAQGLMINQAPDLAAVPVVYMECNAGAFVVGDRCVVRFMGQDWARPRVVGFVAEPKSCGPTLRGVPDSASTASLSDSSSWLVRFNSPMPEQARVVGAQSAHPGHVTWASPHFLTGQAPVELSWRGPDDRYSRITYWEYGLDGKLDTRIDLKTGALASYKPSPYLWVNGVMRYTGIEWIVAAALHRPSALEPEGVVLRVCAEVYPVGSPSSVRSLAMYELVPAGATAPVALAALLEATAFDVLGAYPATQFSTAFNLPVTGTWIHRQRPHFDNRGARVATCISWRDVPDPNAAPRIVAVSFDPKTWTMLETFGAPGVLTQAQTSVTSFTYVPASSPPLIDTASGSYTRTITMDHKVLVAVDYLDDEFVHLTLQRNYQQVATAQSSGSRSIGYENWTDEKNTSVKLMHSKYGELSGRTYTLNSSGSFTDYGAGTQTGPAIIWDWTNFAFAGDLSRDVFSFGWPVPAVQTDTSVTRQTVAFDIFAGHFKMAADTNGGYAMEPNLPQDVPRPVRSGVPMCKILAESGIELTSYSTTFAQPFADAATWNDSYTHHTHSAVHISRGLAYFGVRLWYQQGGLEIAAARSPTGNSWEVKPVPYYVDGDGPTITAPFFAYRKTGSLL